MKTKERIIVEYQNKLKGFTNSMQINIWIISTFGMKALKNPTSLQKIYEIMEKHGIKTYRIGGSSSMNKNNTGNKNNE